MGAHGVGATAFWQFSNVYGFTTFVRIIAIIVLLVPAPWHTHHIHKLTTSVDYVILGGSGGWRSHGAIAVNMANGAHIGNTPARIFVVNLIVNIFPPRGDSDIAFYFLRAFFIHIKFGNAFSRTFFLCVCVCVSVCVWQTHSRTIFQFQSRNEFYLDIGFHNINGITYANRMQETSRNHSFQQQFWFGSSIWLEWPVSGTWL